MYDTIDLNQKPFDKTAQIKLDIEEYNILLHHALLMEQAEWLVLVRQISTLTLFALAFKVHDAIRLLVI